jgi:hypothetical protein
MRRARRYGLSRPSPVHTLPQTTQVATVDQRRPVKRIGDEERAAVAMGWAPLRAEGIDGMGWVSQNA